MSFFKKVELTTKLVGLSLIFLPISLFSQTSHTVVKGDTLYSIAKRYNTTVEEIRKKNGLADSSVVQIGKKLVIPTQSNSTATEKNSSNSPVLTASTSTSNSNSTKNSTPSEWESYTIKKGDTLFSLAKARGITLNELLAKNGLTQNQLIKLGQKIVVPKISSSATQTQVAKAATSSEKKSTAIANNVNSIYNTNSTKGSLVGTTNLIWPTDGKVFSLTGKVKGVQIEAKKGSSVKSISSGTVVWAAPFRGYGKMVVVQNSDYSYTYCGNESLFVKVGDKVSVGQKIGSVGVNAHDEDSKIILLTYKGEKGIDPSKAPRQ